MPRVGSETAPTDAYRSSTARSHGWQSIRAVILSHVKTSVPPAYTRNHCPSCPRRFSKRPPLPHPPRWLGTFFSDEMLVNFFGAVSRPAEVPWRLALVTIVQHAEGLSDGEVADAVRDRLSLKYLLSLEIDDPGFHYSILSRFRSRLVEGGAEHLLLDTLVDKCKEAGFIKTRGKSRNDST